MDITPNKECSEPLSAISRMPASIEEAMAHIESKFPLILESTMAYEEFEVGNSITRATHVTFSFREKIEGPATVRNVLNAWFICMLESVINSSRQRMYWRLKPTLNIVPVDDGFAVEIRSRSAMV